MILVLSNDEGLFLPVKGKRRKRGIFLPNNECLSSEGER